MPSICLSSALTTAASCNLFQSVCTSTGNLNSGACASQAPFMSWNNSGGGGIRIMKGVPPVSFSEINSYVSRSADVLMTFAATASNVYFVNTSTVLTNPVVLTTYPLTATASGIATWFWGFQRIQLNTGDSNAQPNRFYGTVGLQGSGADLEISDTNIVSGNVYKVINLRIGIPQSYTY